MPRKAATRLAGLFPLMAFVVAASFAAYLFFLPLSVYWLDSPEFMAAANGLGLAHPPGHPVVAMLMKLFLLLPVGDAPFRANLFSATFAACAAGLTAGISYVVAARRRDDAWAMLVGACSGLLFAACRSMFIQAMAAEVYTFNAALLLGATLILLVGPARGRRPDDARSGMAAGVLLGLAFANHHYLALLAVPALVAAFWVDRSSWRPMGLTMAACAFVTIAAYMYLPVRSAAGAWPLWTSVSSVSDFIWYASAAIFSQSLGPVSGPPPSPDALGNPALALVLIGGSVGPIVPVLALGGLYMVARLGQFRQAGVVLLLLAGGFVSKVAMGILDPSNPDDHGYFLLALAAIAIAAPQPMLMPVAATESTRRAPRIVFGILSGVAMLVLVAWAAVGGIKVGQDRARFDHTDRVNKVVWDSVPFGGVALVSHYPVYFLMQYDQEVEGMRPDATVIQESLYFKALAGRAYAAGIARRDPDLGPLVADFLARGAISWPEVTRLASRRPVVVEASPDFDAPRRDVEYAGWFFRVRSPGALPTDPDFERAVAQTHVSLLRRELWGAAGVNVETRRVAVRNLAASSEWLAGREGYNPGAALDLLNGALELNPDDRAVRQRVDELKARMDKHDE